MMQIPDFRLDGSRRTWIIAAALGVIALIVIVWQLGVFGDSADALAKSPNAADRQTAVKELADRGSEKAARILTNLAADSDPMTARMAVKALGNVRNEVNLEALAKILSDRKLPAVARSEAAATLGKFKQVDPTKLTQALATDTSAEVRAGAAKGLARLQQHGTIPQLSAALEDPDPEVRRWAITGIHNMIVRRFPYDADKSPASQMAVINRIREYLRKCKAL